MPNILIQFHALRSELLPIVNRAVADFGLHVAAIKYSPFKVEQVAADELAGVFSDQSPYSEIALVFGGPAILAERWGDFSDRNPSELRLRLGKRTPRGLEQSSLSARTSDEEALAVWRQIARRIKTITQVGAIAVNPDTGATAESRNHRFTTGAKELELHGLPILPVAGGCILRLVGSTNK